MSSSMFIEPPAQLPEDLVVVYGKSGVSIDTNDLEKLIEEKTVQSISVIRLTSPTPSMEDAEEVERLEAEKNAQDSSTDTDELTDTDANESKRSDTNIVCNERSVTETEEYDSDISSEHHTRDEDKSDHDESLFKKRKANLRKKSRRRGRTNTTKQGTKQRAELVGLKFEGFYEADAALEIAKEACKMAGVAYIRRTAEHDAMVLAVNNDHCYTPFTSPEQMKAKLAADKLEAEEIRKVQPQLSAQAKQVILMKARKPQLATSSSVLKTSFKKPTEIPKERRVEEKSQQGAEDRSLHSADDFDEEEETYELIDVDSDYSASEKSAESDNDRDSDLDFDVSNRQLKKRKIPITQKKVRKITVSKQTIDKRQDERTVPANTFAASTSTQRPVVASKARLSVGNALIGQHQMRSLQSVPSEIVQKNPIGGATTTAAGVTKVAVNKLFARPAITITPKLQRPTQVTQTTTAPFGSATPPETSKRAVNIEKIPSLQSPKQNVKEIVINKVMSCPKGGFTELGTLISAGEMSQKQEEANTSKSAASIVPSALSNIVCNSPTITSRGFMRIDAASKSQLPAQISIETHCSSNELAAEHDKQLDLIDSIVKDELNKSLEKEIIENSSIGINENIPKLVEMLENTEKALVSNKTSGTNMDTTRNINTSSTISSTHVDDIDISHGLPEDLLQHVVELIEDDKTLKEAVEKQILENQSFISDTSIAGNQSAVDQQQKASISSAVPTGYTILPTVQLIQPSTSKSIIQMSISNISSPSSMQTSSPSYTSKTSPLIRRDPIQIVRGNGRVITLPPIEAPTTRAKRRAQVTPSSAGQQLPHSSDQANVLFLNESSLDSSVHSNTSFSAVPTATGSFSMATPSMDESFGTPNEKKSDKTLTKRLTSKEEKNVKKTSATKAAATRKSGANELLHQEDTEASESQGDDDDPNKLWCICRQPHNNRFMICCDVCGDWFHGKCVNITKAMGREMEQKGKEWTCPLCKKKLEEKQQRKLTDMLQVKRSNSQSSTSEKSKPQNVVQTLSSDKTMTTTTNEAENSKGHFNKEANSAKKVGAAPYFVVQTLSSSKKTPISQNEGERKLQTKTIGQGKVNLQSTTQITRTTTAATNSNVQVKSPQIIRSDSALLHKTLQSKTPAKVANIACVMCKKPARPSTVYCSDDCIRRCAQNAINVITAKTADQACTVSNTTFTLDDKKKKQKGLFEDLLSMPDRKPKIERITVYDRKSGTKFSGSNAPTTQTIKKWLLDNPTYEIVLPGSQLSLEIEQKQHQPQRILPVQKVIEDTAYVSTSGFDKSMTKTAKTNPSMSTSEQTSTPQKSMSPQTIKTPKHIVDEAKQINQRSSTPKQLQKNSQQVQSKSTKEDAKPKERQQLKRQTSESSAVGGSGSSSKRKSVESAPSTTPSTSVTPTDSEPIRMNVRRTLKNEILQRMRESVGNEGPKLTTEEVEAFVKQTESELYHFFGRDTGPKYRNKYRSLMFNIKDRKNRTLFAKICAKQVEPKRLVQMSGAELASQELAKWREEENKHQLEMIKKSELEMLSCNKNYLFKNHKGEEIIEGKETGVCVNLDITTPVEDVVNLLNSSTVGMGSFENDGNEVAADIYATSPGKQLVSPLASSIDDMSPQGGQGHNQHSQHHHHQHQSDERSKSRQDVDKHHRSKSREHDRNRDDAERERDRRERHHRSRSKDRQRERHHRDKSRSRRRSRSHSKSRSRSHERRHKSLSAQHRDERRDRDKERKSGSDHKLSTNLAPKTPPNIIAQTQLKDKHRQSPISTKQKHQKQSTSLECFNLIDQIIESSKTVEEAANLVKDKVKEKPKAVSQSSLNTSATPISSSSLSSLHEGVVATTPAKRVTSTSDSDQEPTSTVSIPTPPREEPTFSRTNSPTDLEPATIWSGSISMTEVAALQINIHPLIGNSQDISSLLPEALDVVGRIDNETVWEYLWKIRKSPNKEIVLIRLTPQSDDDIDGYAKLFNYLDQKKRLGVIKSLTPQIKDIYIFPLGSGKQLPKVLQVTSDHVFYNDAYRADVIVGILVCVTGKRGPMSNVSTSATHVSSSPHLKSTSTAKLSRRHRSDATGSFTPPGSPKRKKRTHKTDYDLDAIIKAPIVRKPAAATTANIVGDDADEPYSPGGSSDEDLVSMYTAKPQPSVLLGLASADEDLKRKMEEINRQIAAQEIEIAGLLNADATAGTASVLANISIPSNLPQILASINKSKEASGAVAVRPHTDVNPANRSANTFEEYNPEETTLTSNASSYTASTQPVATTPPTSRLAQLTEAELLSMVPDDMLMEPAITKQPTLSSYYKEPPPPGV